ncbi:MAG: hypothetical protein VXX30_04890 [Planctomycetota bacterium]|nr:hypothetical protein [Planctomycetota bacterium]
MARKNRKKKRGPGGGPPSGPDEGAMAEIEGMIESLRELDEPATWGRLQRSLLKLKADPGMVARAVIGRDLEGVQRTLNVLRGEEPVQAAPEAPALPEVEEEVLREAMKAYRKRMKLMKLDHESKLGRSPLSTGKGADFESILPPEQYGPEVWQVLAARGQLEATGHGFYKLPTERPSF